MQSVSIIGVGRIGGALAIALSRHGFKIDRLVYRDDSTVARVLPLLPSGVRAETPTADLVTIDSDILIIATRDPEIGPVAGAISKRLKPGRVVLHTSGSLSADILAPLSEAGHSTGSLHPLISISDPIAGAESFGGAFFCIEGSERALDSARSIADSLGGKTFSIASDRKALYHAAAVTACGHVTALIDVAIEMLSTCGVESDTAQKILFPLIGSTIANLRSLPPSDALTGSFARMDAAAISRHIESIKSAMTEDVLDIYLRLGERSLALVASDHPDLEKVQKIRDLISIAKRKAR